MIRARAMYAGHTTHVTQNGASLNTLGTGNATVTNSSAAPMPTRLAAKMNTVRITWMRTRRRSWLSEDLPSSQDPYSGVSGSRPLCRVTFSRTRPSLRATVIVGPASFADDAPEGVRLRWVIPPCPFDYVGRLTAHLPSARRLLLFKADGSVSVHADDRAYKPLNWMSPPCWLAEELDGPVPIWVVENKTGEQLRITVEDIEHDSSHELGVDPGLVKDGVEAHLQALLAEHVELLGTGYTLVRREYMTAIGPVDLLCRDEHGRSVAVEIKRRGEIDGVEQLTRYLELLNRDTLLAPVAEIFAAQQIKPQARTLAIDRGIRCVTLDYDQMRGTDSDEFRLF